jgi:predicted transcriptional regulator
LLKFLLSRAVAAAVKVVAEVAEVVQVDIELSSDLQYLVALL